MCVNEELEMMQRVIKCVSESYNIMLVQIWKNCACYLNDEMITS